MGDNIHGLSSVECWLWGVTFKLSHRLEKYSAANIYYDWS